MLYLYTINLYLYFSDFYKMYTVVSSPPPPSEQTVSRTLKDLFLTIYRQPLLPPLNPGKHCFLSVRDLPFYKFHINGIIKHTVFFVYFISVFVDTFEIDPCHRMFLQSSPYQYWIVFPCINIKNVFNHSARWWIFGLLAVVFFSPMLNHKYLWTFLLDTGFCWFSPFH